MVVTKKYVSLVFAFLLILAGCASEREPQDEIRAVGVFSYGAVDSYYSINTDGVMRSGFRNTQPSSVNDAEQALALAKNECIVKYDSIVVSYDEETQMYCVCFYRENVSGGDQLVYLDNNGLTQLVVFGK